MILGSKAEVTRPKLPSVKVLSTLLNCVWFQVLKVSRRNSKRLPRDSLSVKFLKSERFQFWRPGPRRALWPMVPNVPNVGTPKADLVYQIGLPFEADWPPLRYTTGPFRLGRLVAPTLPKLP